MSSSLKLCVQQRLCDRDFIVASMNGSVSSIHREGVHRPRFVRGQSIRQRPPGTATQNSRFGGVPRAWW